MQVFWSLEGVENLPEGVQGGSSPTGPSAYVVRAGGAVEEHPDIIGAIELEPGERVGSRSAGGGGYGPAYAREPDLVLLDVREGYVSVERAADAYGVVLTGDPVHFETLAVDDVATRERRGRVHG